MVNYSKTYLDPSEQVNLLISRGLVIDNSNKTQQYLKRIGYYRMSAYLYPLLATPKEAHVYKIHTSIDFQYNTARQNIFYSMYYQILDGCHRTRK